MTFKEWLEDYQHDERPIGDLARAMIEEEKIVEEYRLNGLPFIAAEGTFSIYWSWRNSHQWIKNHLSRMGRSDLIPALDEAWMLYRHGGEMVW